MYSTIFFFLKWSIKANVAIFYNELQQISFKNSFVRKNYFGDKDM